jgi:hypothetical protein
VLVLELMLRSNREMYPNYRVLLTFEDDEHELHAVLATDPLEAFERARSRSKHTAPLRTHAVIELPARAGHQVSSDPP